MLSERAASYFDGGPSSEVRLVLSRSRRNASIYHYSVASDAAVRGVVIKVWHAARRTRTVPDELRVLPVGAPGERSLREHDALRRIEQHFATAADPRFGAIRVLDHWPGQRALVLAECPDPGLDDLFARSRRRGRAAPPDLEPAIRNAGAWLRVFHALDPPPDTETLGAKRIDWLESVDRLTAFLAGRRVSAGVASQLRERSRAAAERLPECPSVGVVHGDFVPRNVLVGAAGRVTVFDTRARWCAPAYGDVARFLVALRSGPWQAASQGLLYPADDVERLERAFLGGYFGGEAVPIGAVRLFEAQRLLEMWVLAVHQQQFATGVRWLGKRMRLALWSRFLARRLSVILDGAAR